MDLIKLGEVKTERSPEEEAEKLWQGYLLAMKEARRLGVTSVQNAGGADFEAYEKLQKEGELTCRIDIGKPLTGDTAVLMKYRQLKRSIPMRVTGYGSVILRHSLMDRWVLDSPYV